ncbi:hypothetical protein PISMIDRAFT_17950 [Pisolithus microcarpus 441]|uniref:Uncharacterized protein n=1 Tax=Pisolithus microcarpus 441 TaxID=765257 RepID=A0A0C9XMB7_9AGAM|nr:hypothetical protein BKA83DRAFT_17950 [Pisolithus microcarpus]KIK13485.1 hypothetical protein PISMIDRAFT_17950 [Pisolithus microcarpus 441]
MQAHLVEACMEIGDTDELDFDSNGGLDYSNSDQGTIGLPPLDEDDGDELDDAPPVYLKYFQPFMHSIPPWPIYCETPSNIYTVNLGPITAMIDALMHSTIDMAIMHGKHSCQSSWIAIWHGSIKDLRNWLVITSFM